MATTSTCIMTVKVEPVDRPLDHDGRLYDYSASHPLTGARRVHRRSPLRLEGQSCSTVYGKRHTSHRHHRPRPLFLPMSRASGPAVVPMIKQEAAPALIGPPLEHPPNSNDVVHVFWANEVVGNFNLDSMKLQRTTWMNAVDLLCDRAKETKMRHAIRPGKEQQTKATKCKCPVHIAKCRQVALDWLVQGNKTRTKFPGTPDGLPPYTAEYHPIIAQFCKWFLWRSEFSTLSDADARTAAYDQRKIWTIGRAFPTWLTYNKEFRRDVVAYGQSSCFAATRELEWVMQYEPRPTVQADPVAGPVRTRRSSTSSSMTLAHPYPPTSRPTHVKTEPQDDKEALYQQAGRYDPTTPRVKKEEDFYP